MVFIAAVSLIWALGNFGAVLPSTSMLLMWIWFFAVALLGVWEVLTHGRLDYLVGAAFLVALIGILFLGPTVPMWIVVALWMWKIARDNPQRAVKYLRFLVLIGLLESSLGLIQYFVAPGWIFGYRNTTGNAVSGTLINRNHFAGLLEMLIPCCLGLGFITARRFGNISRSYLYILAAALMGLALALSLSRMGIFCFLITLLALSILLLLRQSARRMALGLGLGLFGLVVTGVVWVGVDVIVKRYADLFATNTLAEDSRGSVFRDTVRMIRTFPEGVGIKRYQDVFRRFQTLHPEVLFDHAHNDYLETTAEWGIAPALVFWVIVGAAFFSFIRHLLQTRSDQEQGILLACVGAVFTILIHSFADFNLQIPSNAVLFFTFIGLGLGVIFPTTVTRLKSINGVTPMTLPQMRNSG
jgi:O-antigen ligase